MKNKSKENGLALRQQSQALNPKTELSVMRVSISLDHIKTDTQQPNLLGDAASLADDPRAFLAQIQKRLVGGRHG
jgi:hypothetical protein